MNNQITPDDPIFNKLSLRESEIYIGLLEGKTDQEISDKLKISIHTVKSHIKSTFFKLNVKTRLQAAALYIVQQQNLSDLPKKTTRTSE